MANHNRSRPTVRPSEPPNPRAPGRWHKLWVVPRSGEHRVICIGEKVVWVWRHYCPNRQRFLFCLDSIGQKCLLCESRHGREQSGYLPVLLGQEQRTMVVTSGAWLHSPSLRNADGDLRGYEVYAVRLHPRANGPLRVWLTGEHIDPRRLPSAWDVLRELDVRFGLAEQENAPAAAQDLGLVD